MHEVEHAFHELCPKSLYESYGTWRKRIARRFGISVRLVESIHYREIKDLKAQHYAHITSIYKSTINADRAKMAKEITKNIRVGETINATLYQDIKGLLSQLS